MLTLIQHSGGRAYTCVLKAGRSSLESTLAGGRSTPPDVEMALQCSFPLKNGHAAPRTADVARSQHLSDSTFRMSVSYED